MQRVSLYIYFNQRGQTLIELMAAVFVITTGLLGVLGLTTANVRSETTAVMRLTGFNLAREGVELARNIRDSNWLAGEVWSKGLGDLSTHCSILSSAPSVSPFQILKDASASSCITDQFDSAYRIYVDTGLHTQYAQGETPSANAIQTPYYRRILLDPICLDTTQDELDVGLSSSAKETVKVDGACDISKIMIGIQVTSEAVWKLAGRTQSTRVIDRLYNWR